MPREACTLACVLVIDDAHQVHVVCAWRHTLRLFLRQPGLPETLIVSLHESAVFRVVGLRALLDRGEREIGRADLLADSQGRAGFDLPTEER